MNIHVYWYSVAALNIGHTGNVRFLTFAELITDSKQERRRSVARQSLISKLLVISGGDGYEVIDPTQQPKETVGFNDSINHLLAWNMWPLDYYRWISENKLFCYFWESVIHDSEIKPSDTTHDIDYLPLLRDICWSDWTGHHNSCLDCGWGGGCKNNVMYNKPTGADNAMSRIPTALASP